MPTVVDKVKEEFVDVDMGRVWNALRQIQRRLAGFEVELDKYQGALKSVNARVTRLKMEMDGVAEEKESEEEELQDVGGADDIIRRIEKGG